MAAKLLVLNTITVKLLDIHFKAFYIGSWNHLMAFWSTDVKCTRWFLPIGMSIKMISFRLSNILVIILKKVVLLTPYYLIISEKFFFLKLEIITFFNLIYEAFWEMTAPLKLWKEGLLIKFRYIFVSQSWYQDLYINC